MTARRTLRRRRFLSGPAVQAAALARRDLAMQGYLELRDAVVSEGPSALAALHARAARLVQPRVAEWRATWETTVAAEVERTRRQLDALSDGLPGALGAASVARATPVGGDPAFGMCGRLTTWDWELILRVKDRCPPPPRKIHDNDHPMCARSGCSTRDPR